MQIVLQQLLPQHVQLLRTMAMLPAMLCHAQRSVIVHECVGLTKLVNKLFVNDDSVNDDS